MNYDIFISYKRISMAMANNLYYRLSMRGYSTFFDLEEMRNNNFDEQIYHRIDEANDIFVVLEEHSLDACKSDEYKNDWFCKEIIYSLKQNKNIIPMLLEDFQMPPQSSLPPEMQDLCKKNALLFNVQYFDNYIDKLISNGFISSSPQINQKVNSVFKFLSNEDCSIYENGNLIGKISGRDESPFFVYLKRKGEFRYKCVNDYDPNMVKVVSANIDTNEEKFIDIEWQRDPDESIPSKYNEDVKGDTLRVPIGNFEINMIRVEGGKFEMGASKEQARFAENMEYPAHKVKVDSFYMSEFPVVQSLWEYVMGYNKSRFRESNVFSVNRQKRRFQVNPRMISDDLLFNQILNQSNTLSSDVGMLPVETINIIEAKEFVKRLSSITNLNFDIPSEIEWEYAARGGKKSKHYIYSGSDNIDEVAWYGNNSDGITHPVGLKKPNELGLYDMSGNVWEWTKSNPSSYRKQCEYDDGTSEYYIRRGGSWWHDAKNCRVSKRYVSHQNKSTSGLGLRLVVHI